MTKKAQGLPMNVIIIAAIAIVVLIIVVVIFRARATQFAKDVESCFAKGGVCLESPVDSKCQERIYDAKCPDEAPYCCVSLT